jgi:hypothetical protein
MNYSEAVSCDWACRCVTLMLGGSTHPASSPEHLHCPTKVSYVMPRQPCDDTTRCEGQLSNEAVQSTCNKAVKR